MSWTVRYLASARKGVRKIDPQDRARIRQFLEQRLLEQSDPRDLGKALRGEFAQLWRYRVGYYRVICEIRDAELVVLVIRIAHRKDIYRD